MIIHQYSSCDGFQHQPQEMYKKKKINLFRLYSNARMKMWETPVMPADIRGSMCTTWTGPSCADPSPGGVGNPLNPTCWRDWGLQLFPLKRGIPCRHASEAQTDLAPVLCTHRPMGEDLGLAPGRGSQSGHNIWRLYLSNKSKTVYSIQQLGPPCFVKHLRPSCVVAITVW